MGLNEDTTGIYVTVTEGKLRKKCDASDPKAKKRVVIDDNDVETTKWERVWKDVDGTIIGIILRRGKFGRQYILTLQEGEDTFNLCFGYESKYATTLLERLPNVDFSKSINLVPYSVKDKGQEHPNTGVTIWQGKDNKIPSFYREYDKDGKMTGWKNNAPQKPAYDPDNYNENEAKKYKIDFYDFLEKTLPDIQQKIFEANPIEYELDEHNLPANEKTMDEEAGNKAPPLKAEDEH